MNAAMAVEYSGAYSLTKYATTEPAAQAMKGTMRHSLVASEFTRSRY